MYAINCQDAVKNLKNFGLCEYEAKVYFTLLVTGKSKAGDAARRSGVPQSNVYLVLESLEERGLVKVDGTPKEYTPTGFSKFARRTVRSKESEIASIRRSVAEVEKLVSTMRPLAKSYRGYRVFEPKYRRRRF